jgi:MFS transporter, DHA1 family, multidrug resistance protein
MPWPGIFVFLAGYGTLVIVAALFLVRETLPPEKRGQSGMTAGQRYKVLFTDRIFVGLLVVGGMNFAGLFTYLSASPFLFQDIFGFSPQQYGLLFGINSLASWQVSRSAPDSSGVSRPSGFWPAPQPGCS